MGDFYICDMAERKVFVVLRYIFALSYEHCYLYSAAVFSYVLFYFSNMRLCWDSLRIFFTLF